MSIRNIFSRSTGSINRRNASRKAARRQVLRKRLLGHETLEDRRLLAVDVGLNFTGSSTADSGFIPPDTMGAVGPNHIVEFLNGRYQVYNKATGASLQSKTLNTFWVDAGAVIPSGSAFDPRIVFDPASDTWFASSINGGAGNTIFVARSDTSDPTGDWDSVQLIGDTVDGTRFNDYDTLSVDADSVNLATNNFSGGPFDVSIYTIPKSSLLAGVPTLTGLTRFEAESNATRGNSIQPALNFGPSLGTTPAIGTPFGSGTSLFRTDIIGAGAAGATLSATTTIPVTPYDFAPPARQPNGVTIENVSPRLTGNLVYNNGSLWAAHAVEGSFGTNSAIRWYQIDEASNTVLQEGMIEDATLDFLDPSIAVNEFGFVTIGATASGPDAGEFASAVAFVGFTINGLTGPTTTFEPMLTTRAGDDNYFQDFGSGRNRWGDYSATVVDPSDAGTFWTFQEFADSASDWSIQITELSLSDLSISIDGDGTDNEFLVSLDVTGTVVEIEIDGVITDRFPIAALSDLTFNGLDGDDTLTVDYTNGNPIPAGGIDFDGGGQGAGGDTLIVNDGAFATITSDYLNTNDGSVDLDGSVITYTGLEPVLLNVGTAADMIFNLPAGVNPDVLLGDDTPANFPGNGLAAANTSAIDGSTFEYTSFTNPTNSLTVNGNFSADTISMITLDGGWSAPTINLNGDSASDEIRIAATPAGTTTNVDTENGVPLDLVMIGAIVGSAGNTATAFAQFNTGVSTLDFILGDVNTADAGGVGELYVDDSGDPDADAVTFTNSSISGASPGTIFYDGAQTNIVQLALGTSADTINVLSTGADDFSINGTVVFGNDGDDAFTINGDGLSGNNTFQGNAGNDSFTLNVTAELGSTAVAYSPLQSLQIAGNDPAADSENRDRLTINDNSGAARSFTYDYLDSAGDLDLENGFAIPVELRTTETLIFNSLGADNDSVTVEGTSGDDDLTVALRDNDSSALVFLGGNPYASTPPETIATNLPGLAGGGQGPDILINGLAPVGLTLDGTGNTGTLGLGNRAFIYAASELDLLTGGALNIFGFGPGVLVPGFGAGDAYDEIEVNTVLPDGVRVTNNANGPLVDVRLTPGSFDQFGPAATNQRAALIVNGGDEAVPQANGVADDFTALPSPDFNIQVNGNLPGFALGPNGLPVGDRLTLNSPSSINVFSDKATPPLVTTTFDGDIFGIQDSSIEQVLLTPGNGELNLVGDNNDPAVDQTDNFVVVGRNIDFPGDIDGGVGEGTVVINGSTPRLFNDVTDLNAFGDDQNPPPGTPSAGNDIDTLEITPYADDTPRGWGIDVAFDEGNPVGVDGDQADLLIVHTSLFGGAVSEDILIRPSGPDNGEVVITNGSFGTPIVDIDYVGNTDIIVLDDDGFLNDTDTLTLLGTDGVTPATSGNETVAADFDAAGGVATPMVTVSDTDSGSILYRLRSVAGIETVAFDLLDGNDDVTIASPLAFGYASGVGQMNVTGGKGADTLTYDIEGRDIGHAPGLNFDGGEGVDAMTVSGTPAFALTSTTYSIGSALGDGQVVLSDGFDPDMTIDFQNLEPVALLAPTPTLTVNANNASNAISYTQSPVNAAWGRVAIDGFEVADFANAGNLTINALGGSDAISLNNPTVPTALTSVTVNGGDPSTDSDSVEILGTAADDTFAYTPTAANGGTVVQAGAIAMTYTLATVESLAIDAVGQAATDALTVTTANATITPGGDPGTGVVDPVSATGAPLLSATYADVESATVTGTTAVVQGTAENDTIDVSAAGIVTVTNELGFTNTVDVSGFNALVINALGGDDSITIDGAAAFAGGISVLGGDNGTSSDELNLTGAAATAETVNISPSGTNGTSQTITGLGSTITVDGTELIVYDAADGDDTLEVDPDFGSRMRIDSAPQADYDRAVSDSLPEIQWTNLLLFQATPGGTNDYTTTFVTSGLFGATNYELNSQLSDKTLVIEGDGEADSFTLVNPATGEVAITDNNRGITVTSVGTDLELLRIESLGGDDTVTVNVAPDVIAVPIEYDGGEGSDLLTVSGTPNTAVDEVIYSPGAAVTAGRLAYEDAADTTLMTIDFTNLEPVVDLVPAATLTVNATNADNAVNYSQSPTNAAWGRVSVDGFETIDFAQKQNLILNGLAGDDTINLNNPATPTALTAITVNGGDPTASDTVIVNNTEAGVDIIIDTLSTSGAVVTGAQPVPVTIATSEHVTINGQANDDDMEVITPLGSDRIVYTPGADATRGELTIREFTGSSYIGLNYVNFDVNADLILSDVSGTRDDQLDFQATQADDEFSIDAAGQVTLDEVAPGSAQQTLDVLANGVRELNLFGFDGDDIFNVVGDHPFSTGVTVQGGNPGASDVLNFTGTGAAVTVDLGAQTVAETGFFDVDYSGIETINADAGGVGLNVVATAEDDDVTVTVLDANSGQVEHGYTMNRLGQPISAAKAPLVLYTNTGGAAVDVDLAAGEDTLNVVGNALAQTFDVDVTTSTVAIDDAPVVGNDGTVTYQNNESLGVFGLEGDDTFDVTPGAIPLFIDGGDPIGESAGDTINTNAGGNPVVFEPGPENDEGGILVAGSQRISYDHIEALGAIAAMKALILGTNGDDDITVIARDGSTHAGADGIQDFTVSVNDGPAILFLDTPELYIDALSGDDDIVLRTPAPNDASWDVEVFIAGGAPSDGAANEGDRLVLETPGNDTIIYTPTGSDTGTILIDDDNDGINDGVGGGFDSLITIGQFVCPVLNYTSDPGGVELFEYDGEAGADSLTIVSPAGDDTILHTPGAGFDEGSLRVNTTLGIDYQNLGAAAVLTVADTGGDDTLVAGGTASDDAFDVAATSGAVSLVTASATYLAINQTQVENLTLDGLDGNDDFVINGPQPYDNISVLGGGPGGSDVLTVNGAAATDETFTVNPAFDRGDGTVSVNALLVPYVGIEHVLLDANGGDNDDLVINDDDADNVWTVDAGPILGDRVQIDDRESIDFVDFNDVTLNNDFGTDRFDVYPTQLVGFDGDFTVNGDAAGGAEPIDDVLNIYGTPADDVITSTASVITTNGVEITPGTNLIEVGVLGLAGNDNITLALALAGVRKVIDGGVGNDNINASTMQDALIFGGLGDDVIVGSPLADLIYGGSGNDTISGLGGDDTIYGDEGNDTITGGTGSDNVFGGADGDLLIWNQGDGSDLVEGGTGNDVVLFNGATAAQVAVEDFTLSAQTPALESTRILLERTQGGVQLDIAAVEQIDIVGDTGVENVQVNDLTHTDLQILNINTGDDGDTESIRVEGRPVKDDIAVVGQEGAGLILGNQPDVVFVLDISGSTSSGFAGTPVGDLNGDGSADTILDAEIAGFIRLNQELIARGLGTVADVSVVAFDNAGVNLDLDPVAPGIQLSTTPLADTDSNGVLDVEQALRTLAIAGGTDFEAALTTAIATFTSLGTTPGNGNLIFLSDGNGGSGTADEVATLTGMGVNIKAYGVGSGSSLPNLQIIDPTAIQFTTTDELTAALGGGGGGGAVGPAAVSGPIKVAGLQYDVNIFNSNVADADHLTVDGNQSDDQIYVQPGVETVIVTTLEGGQGDDYLNGAFNTANGGLGDDFIRGAANDQLINGGDGEDTMVGGPGLDTFDGGAGFDTILVEGFASDDRIDLEQDNPTTLRYEVGNADNGFDGVLGGLGTETDTLIINTVEQVRIAAAAGDDTIRVTHDDSLVAAAVAADMLRIDVDGGDPGASDRLTVTDDGLGDTTVQRLGQTDGDGSFTMYALSGGATIALPPVLYTDIEYASLNPIGPVTGGTGTDSQGRLFVFKYDPYEQNQSLPTATFLGADSTINLDPNIDPGWDADFNTPGDEDWYRVVAETTGVLDFQVYFRQQGLLGNGRAGLPGDGDLEISVYDEDGLVGGVPLAIAGNGTFGTNDTDDNERVRIPAVAGQTYYLRIAGADLAVGDNPNASPAINVYNVSVTNSAPPVPYDLELNDILQVGTVTVNAANTTTFTATLLPANPSLVAPTVANDYIGKTVEFTSGLNIGRQATILNYVAGTFTLSAIDNGLIANPLIGDSFLVETTDTGRSQFDDATRDNTPVITFRLDDDFLLLDVGGNVVNANVAPDEQIPIPFNPEQTLIPTTAGYRVPVFIEGNPQQPLTEPQTPIGYARPLAGTPGVYIFDFGVDAVQAVAGVDAALALTDGSHFINAKVEITDPSSDTITDFGARSQSLEIIVDTDAPEVYFGDPAVVDDGLHPDSDSGDPVDAVTLSDNATNDTTPTFFGRAEANAIIRAYVDRTNDGFTADDLLIGQTVASPLDGSNQHPFGEWEITSTVNMNDPLLTANLGLDGVRNIYLTAEDVEGNTSDANLAPLQIFIDTRGPQVTDVFISNRPDFDLFTLKPETPEPTPRVDSITINVQDLPARMVGFLYPAISNLAVVPNVLPLGLIQLTGDHSGIIPMTSVTFTSDGDLNLPGVQPLAAGNPATGYITLQFADPLPDDRFTLTLSDSIIDPVGNALDGESNASEPVGTPLFPSGDGIPGGDFVARFTIDSRPEVATWSQELVYVDINGNFVWDPEGQDNDATNRDFIYHFGTVTDAYFAGNFNSNFAGPDGIFQTADDAPVAPDDVPSSGFDKMGTFGRFNGVYEFFLDTNDDGIGDTVGPMFYQVNVAPVAGNFFNSTADIAAVANGQRPRDEIGGYDGQNWYLDVNGNNRIDAGEQFPTDLRGIPVVGDFNGDGSDDLAVYDNVTGEFQFDLDRDGDIDDTLNFGFSGFGEKPVTGDVNLDGIDDLVLWVPNRDGQLPEESGEFHYLVSDNPAALPSLVFDSYSPAPLGNDLIAQFGDDFALPLLGNFDPPIGDIEPLDTTGWFTNLNDALDVDNDGFVDSYDALLVINALNRGITSAAPSQALRVQNSFNGHFLDVDGNTHIEPFDVIQIINELNRRGRAGQGEAASDSAAAYAAAVDSVFSSDEDEDELLLDFADNDALRNTL